MLALFLFEFEITALSKLCLQGSSLRGALGSALRQTLCATDLPNCSNCPLLQECAFTQIWSDTTLPETPRQGKHFHRQNSLPRPFVLNVSGENLDEPDTERFRLGLFGSAVRYLPHFISACVFLGNSGLSRERRRFHLDRVRSIDPSGERAAITIFDKTNQESSDVLNSTSLSTAENLWNGARVQQVRLTLQTPTQIAASERIIERPPSFQELIRALLRRYSDLAELYGQGRPLLAFDSIISGAEHIRLTRANIEVKKSRTYSRRKAAYTPCEGLTGWLQFEGDITAFMPFLLFGQWMQIGKQTTFGMGSYQLQWQ